MFGEVDEFDSVDNRSPLTEIRPSSISATGEVAPTPEAITLSSIPKDWEPYEGVLVTLQGVTITSEASSFGEFDTDWDLKIDDDFIEISDVSLTVSSVYNVTGMISDLYGYKILPRSATDIQAN